ncbi:MAG TPA: (Fe-S)-binding protein [Candidatus Lokiarchaeia archaeon]|nr:(Fe-S)-binding protein [Candidatus Lokiarchaeia archaeon]
MGQCADDEKQNEVLRNVANLCYRCKKCAVICPVATSGHFNPRKFISEVNIEAPARAKQGKAFYDTEEDPWWCLTCGACKICPQGLDIPEIVREIRGEMRGESPSNPRFLATETHLNIFPTAFEIMAKNPNPAPKANILKKYAAAHNWPEPQMKQSGTISYYPGCINLCENALVNVDVPQTRTGYAVVRFLNLAGIEPVVVNDYCCGHDALWAGDDETFCIFARRNVKIWKEAGIKTLITSCSEGYRTLSVDYPRFLPDFPFQVEFAPDYFDRNHLFENIEGLEFRQRTTVTIHDPCRSGRLVGGGHYESARNLLRKVYSLKIVEMPNNRDDAKCCGVSAFRNCTDFARDLTRDRIREAMQVGAEYLITTCPKCLSHFQCVIQNEAVELQRQVGREVPKVMDLFSFLHTIYVENGEAS